MKNNATRAAALFLMAILSLSLFSCAEKPSAFPVSIDVAKKGDTVTFGAFPEPISWTVVKKAEGKALLVSNEALFSASYHVAAEDITWEDCSLRGYLNGEFISSAFSEEEREKIIKTRVHNSDSSVSHAAGGNDTDDLVFILSAEEAKEYFKTDAQRRCKASPLAIKQGAYADENDYCWQWLRSPGKNQSCAAIVTDSGEIGLFGHSASGTLKAVRPALWIITE